MTWAVCPIRVPSWSTRAATASECRWSVRAGWPGPSSSVQDVREYGMDAAGLKTYKGYVAVGKDAEYGRGFST